jgi:thymidylate synthase
MNNLDKQYLDLVQDILNNGYNKSDRTGTGTVSVFGRQIRHKMSDGFPLLTTKKMLWNSIVTELLWFLRGDTNIKYLINNGTSIWNGDCYSNYLKNVDLQDIESRKYEDGELTAYTQEEFINKIKTDDEFAKKWGDLGPIYGKQWRRWNGVDKEAFFNSDNLDERNKDARHGVFYKENEVDQIANLINELKTNPDSRRLMVSAWNVGELDKMVLPPCHYGFQVYTRELSHKERCKKATGKDLPYNELNNSDKYKVDYMYEHNIPKRAISLIWNQRSVDVGLGLPFNIASYGLLLEILAKEVNMIPEELIGNLGDCHIYNNHIDNIKTQIIREPYPLPKLKINDGLKIDDCLPTYSVNDFIIENYQFHPIIKLPLSN